TPFAGGKAAILDFHHLFSRRARTRTVGLAPSRPGTIDTKLEQMSACSAPCSSGAECGHSTAPTRARTARSRDAARVLTSNAAGSTRAKRTLRPEHWALHLDLDEAAV